MTAHRLNAHAHPARRGFTTVSMLVALVLMAVGLMSLANASAQTVTMQTLAQNRTNAIAVARAHLEQIRSRDPWTIVSEGAQRVDAEGKPSPGGFYTRTLQVLTTRQNLIRVDVLVDYPRGTQPITLTTALFRGNGLGAR